MIGFDTNVLVRLLVTDDPEQGRRAAALLQQAVASSESVFVSHIVLCETVWVLGSCYEFARGEIADTLDGLLRARGIHVEDRDQAMRALAQFRAGKGDMADFLIKERALAAGCDRVATFDKALLSRPGFCAP